MLIIVLFKCAYNQVDPSPSRGAKATRVDGFRHDCELRENLERMLKYA